MKKLLLAAFAFMISVGLLGCSSGNGDPASSEDTLTILANESNVENPYIQRIFDLYEEKTGKDINVVTSNDTEYEDTVKQMVNAEDAPDVVMLFNNALMEELGGTEQFLDLSDQPWVSDLEDGALAYSSGTQGEVRGLPFWESSVSGCYYNQSILNELGLRPASNQSEFDHLCAALASIGYTPISIGNESGYGIYQFGLDPIVADNPQILEQLNSGELKYSDIPEVRAMITWLKDAHDAGWFGDTTDIAYKDWGPIMSNGDAVMLFVWDTWFDTDFTPGEYTKDDFGIMPVFVGTEDDGTYEGGNLNMFAINRASDNQDQALEFLEFCATPENYNIAFDGISTQNVFKGQTTNVKSPMVQEAAESVAEKLRPSTAEPKIKGYDARAINEAMHQLYNDEISVDDVLKVMDNTLNNG